MDVVFPESGHVLCNYGLGNVHYLCSGGGGSNQGGGAQKVSPPLRGVMKVLRVVGGRAWVIQVWPSGRVEICYIIRRRRILSQRCWDGDRKCKTLANTNLT